MKLGLKSLLLAAVCFAGYGPPPAWAAGPPGSGAETTEAADLEKLAAALEDPNQRAALIRQIRQLAEVRKVGGEAETPEEPAPRDAFEQIARKMEVAGSRLRGSTALLGKIPARLMDLWREGSRPEARSRWLGIYGALGVSFLAGLVAMWIVGMCLNRWVARRDPRNGGERVGGVLRFIAALVADILPLFVFAAAAAGVLMLLEAPPVTRTLTLTLIGAFFCERLVSRVAASLLLRRYDVPPPVPLREETAGYLYIWVRRLSFVGFYGYFIARSGYLLKAAPALQMLLEGIAGLLLAGMVVVLILQNREAVATWIRGPRDAAPAALRALRGFLAGIWAGAAILYVLGAGAIWLLGIEGGFVYLVRATFLTVLIVGIARLLFRLSGSAIRRGFRVSEDLRTRFPALELRVNRYVPLIDGLFKAAIVILAFLALLDAWGLNAFGWVFEGTGRVLLSRAMAIVAILLVALAGWEIVSLLIRRFLERRDPETGELLEASGRARTLLPLLENAAMIAIGAMAALSILSEIGMDITPLLAGAGVVGLAVGFGAQSLVKDVITGIFIVVEDSVAIGDVVDVAGHLGVVESMTIRTIRLRDLEGIVHTVPFGEVTAIRNMTKEFSYSLIQIGVAYREDVDQVIETLKEVGASMQADEKFGDLILEPLEVLGLDSFGDSSVNIRVRFKTRPSQQWGIRREFNRRVKEVFDERGIEIPFPHQTIYFGVDKEGDAPPARVRMESSSSREDSGGKK